MLIEFSVTNYRSFRDRQTVSMVPGTSPKVRSRFSHATSNKHVPYVLKYASIFGGNGAGKSNFVKAIYDFRAITTQSFNGDVDWELDIPFFKLNPACAQTPTEFEAIFLKDGTLFQYGFGVLKDKIASEWLYATPPGGRLQRWIDRSTNSSGDREFYINPSIPGERKTWIDSTRDNALLLSTAVGLNSAQLSIPYTWIKDNISIISDPNYIGNRTTVEAIRGRDKDRVINILRECGIDIVDIVIREEETDFSKILSEDFLKSVKFHTQTIYKVFFVYKNSNNMPVEMAIQDESEGTNILFSLIGPLLSSNNSRILVADELHRSLHPVVFKLILERFFLSPTTAVRGQIIFTTHDTNVLSEALSHPDQINLVEKDRTGSSQINPISNFKIRSDEAVRAGYLAGRYGGLPTKLLPISGADNG